MDEKYILGTAVLLIGGFYLYNAMNDSDVTSSQIQIQQQFEEIRRKSIDIGRLFMQCAEYMQFLQRGGWGKSQ